MEAPKLPKIFKHTQARGFNYQPMYYDEAKEKREELVRRYEGKAAPRTKDSFRSNMQSDWGRSRGKQVGSANGRLIAIIGVLVIVTYLILRF